MSDQDPEPSPPAAADIIPSAPLPDSETQAPQTPQQATESTAPQPPFEPLFTLLTNSTTGATIHPQVQYLFSDDDTSILSSANDDPDHRTVVVDLASTEQNTWSVQYASSLSPDFAITSSQLATQQNDGDTSTMLRLEGVERETLDTSGGSRPGSLPSSGSGALGRDAVELADEFKRRMGVLKKVVGESERRRGIVERQAGGKVEEESESPGEKESAVQGAVFEDEYPG